MFKKICLDLFTILLPLILILTPHPIFAQDINRNTINTSRNTTENSLRDAIRYWWIAPLALIPLLFFLWPKEDGQPPAYRRATVYQSVRKPKKATRRKTSQIK